MTAICPSEAQSVRSSTPRNYPAFSAISLPNALGTRIVPILPKLPDEPGPAAKPADSELSAGHFSGHFPKMTSVFTNLPGLYVLLSAGASSDNS
jgi:hypothetical protein